MGDDGLEPHPRRADQLVDGVARVAARIVAVHRVRETHLFDELHHNPDHLVSIRAGATPRKERNLLVGIEIDDGARRELECAHHEIARLVTKKVLRLRILPDDDSRPAPHPDGGGLLA